MFHSFCFFPFRHLPLVTEPEGASPVDVTTGAKRAITCTMAGQPQQETTNQMEEIIKQLDRIEKNTLLAAKTVLSIEDVAALTGISKSHLYKLTCTHRIPHYKPTGKALYFDRAEVEAWMKQNRVNTQAEAAQAAAAYVMREGN